MPFASKIKYGPELNPDPDDPVVLTDDTERRMMITCIPVTV